MEGWSRRSTSGKVRRDGQRNWNPHFCHNETFRCGRSYAAALMACDEGEERRMEGVRGGEGCQAVGPLQHNNP